MSLALVLVAAFGFAAFMASLEWTEREPDERSDGIVVLTGGAERVEEALGLLARGFGSRLLITGVNERTTRDAIRRVNAGGHELLECCVDLDRRARNTLGNAAEIRRWVEAHGFRSIIVVTSYYHMPRALAELDLAIPHLRKTPFAVIASPRSGEGWLASLARARVFLSEYGKFLAVRLRGHVAAGEAEASAMASRAL